MPLGELFATFRITKEKNMNRWNIDILDVNMQENTRKKILADANLRERLQADLDRLLPLEFDGTAKPTIRYCYVCDYGKPYVVID